MKTTVGALVAVLTLLPVPVAVRAQSIYRCVDPSGNVAFGAGAAPPGGRCSQLTVRAPHPSEPPAAPVSGQTFEEQSKACDDYYRSNAASLSQDSARASLDATCEENTHERDRRDGGQPEAQPSH
jgi:hypothetical protein